MDLNQMLLTGTEVLTRVGLKILGAIAVWIVGRWLIQLSVRLVGRTLAVQKVDATMTRYIGNFIAVVLNILLVIGILGYFGLETTSFAAFIAAAGVAIGAAWSGLLSNFAAGVFLILLRPFQVGDQVAVAGIEGTVDAIGMFSTTIHTADNVRTIVGNGKIFTDVIRNFSATEYRRVDRKAALPKGADVDESIARVHTALAGVPNVLQTPRPEVFVLDQGDDAPVLAVRPYCRNADYPQVFADVNRAITEIVRPKPKA